MKNKFIKGHVGYWKGKTNPYLKSGEWRKCLTCKKDIYAELNEIKKGWRKFCSVKCRAVFPVSMETRKRMSEWQKGNKNRFWLDGNKAQERERYDYKWNIIKKEVYQRDRYTCKRCLKICNYKDIQCHHIVPYRRCEGDINKIIFWNIKINDLANLVTLCRTCHIKQDWIVRKSEERGDYSVKTVLNILT